MGTSCSSFYLIQSTVLYIFLIKEEGSMIFKKCALLPFNFCVPKTIVGMIYALDKIECIDRLFVVCVL